MGETHRCRIQKGLIGARTSLGVQKKIKASDEGKLSTSKRKQFIRKNGGANAGNHRGGNFGRGDAATQKKETVGGSTLYDRVPLI